MDLSFLLPTLNRPYLFDVINSIHQYAANYKYEILLMGPKELNIDSPNIKYYIDDKLNGQIRCYNFLAKQANGKYLITALDDHLFINNIDYSINLLESDIFKNRKFKICTLKSGNVCGLPPYKERFGSCLSHPFNYSNCIIMRYPVIAKETLMSHMDGYLFHPEFFSHAADNYLGYFLYYNKEPGIESLTEISPIEDSSSIKYIVVDCNTALALILNIQNGYNRYVIEPDNNISQYYFDTGKFIK